MDDFFKVIVPQLGVNEDAATLKAWKVSHLMPVRKNDLIAEIETSKTVTEIESEESGFIYHFEKAGSEVKNNSVIAIIGEDKDNLLKIGKNYEKANREKKRPSTFIATKKALKRAAELNIDIQKINSLGGNLIKAADVDLYAKANENGSFANQEVLKIQTEKNPILIFGAGAGGNTVKEALEIINSFEVVCFVDDNKDLGPVAKGKPLFGRHQLEYLRTIGVKSAFVAIANSQIRIKTQNYLDALGFNIETIVHTNAFVSPSAKIGKGSFIKAGSVIETNCVIGSSCIIDNNTTIAHDSTIGDGVHLAPNSATGGFVEIGSFSIIGIGSSIATGIKIGKHVITSLGTSVIKDIPDQSIFEGVPGKLIGKRII